MLKVPVYVSWTRGVTDEESKAMMGGVFEMITLAGGADVRVFGSESYLSRNEDYSSPEWYVTKSLMFIRPNPQVDGDRLLGLMLEEPWQKKIRHFDVMFIDQDMTSRINGAGWYNFVFGLSQPGCSMATSVHRYRQEANDNPLYYEMLKNIARHEFGHVLRLVSRTNGDQRGGIYEGHCKNICAMKQIMSVDEALILTQELRNQEQFLCSDCRKELYSSR